MGTQRINATQAKRWMRTGRHFRAYHLAYHARVPAVSVDTGLDTTPLELAEALKELSPKPDDAARPKKYARACNTKSA